MKKASLSKTLVSLALTMALALGAAAMLYSPQKTYAAGEFTADLLIDADPSAAITAAADGYEAGLTVDAAGGTASGRFNAVFTGNTELKFQFPTTAGWGETKGKTAVFTVTDLAGNDVFSVHYEGGADGYGTGAYLTYGDEYRATANNVQAFGWSSCIYYAYRAIYTNSGMALPYLDTQNKSVGSLSFEWEGEVLSVYHTSISGETPSRLRLAAFDGTENDPDIAEAVAAGSMASTMEEINTTAKFALPKIYDRLKDGYMIRFETAGDVNIDFVSVNDENLAAMQSAPAYYETYNSATFITLDGQMPSVFAVGYTRTLPAATYTDAAGSAPAPVEKITLTDPENHTTDITATREVTPSAFGDYTVTYIAEVGAENAGNEYSFTFSVSGYGMEAEGLFDYGSDALYSVSKTGDYTGVHFAPVSSAGYKAGFNGVFTGDTELIFRFPSAAAVGTTKGRSVTFTVSDLDGNEAFRVEFSGGDGWDTLPTLFYENEIRAGVTNAEGANQWTPKIFFTERLMDAEHGCGFPYFNATNNAQTGSLSLEWEDDVLAVYYIARDGREKLKLAAFDGTDTTYEIPAEGYAVYDSAADINENGVFALPKIYDRLKGGYSISMQVVGETTVNFVSVNGVSMSDDFVSINYAHEIVQEEEQNGTIYVPQGCDIAPAVVRYETIVAGGWKFINEESAAIEADTSSAGTKTYIVESDLMADVYQAVSKEYTVVVETAYKLIFDTRGGDAITAIDWSEHTAYRLGGAFPVPVRDYWKFDGWYADAAYNDPITLEEIKAEKGTVTVYAKWLDDVAPVIELDGAEDVSTVQAGEVVVGESDVRVSDAAQGDDVTLTIEVKYQNGAFEALTEDYDFTRVGAYVIRYTAKDPSGNAAYVERTINVIDELPPEITLSGEIPESGFTGIAITLPAATATENAQVVLTVTLNGEEIALSGNAFTPTVAGEYEAVYSATDANDNTATVRQVISVADDIAAPVISGGLENSVVKKGEAVSVTAASATDNCDGSVTVTYKVYYGTEEVAVENGSFKAENIGVYRVEYTARDSSGNVANKNVEITVTATGTTDGGDGANSGSCNSSLGGAPWIAGFALAAAAALAIAKRGRARKNKGR